MHQHRATTLHWDLRLEHDGTGPSWALPKGEYDDTEEALAAAQREFTEETGLTAKGPFLELGELRQKSGKRVKAWALLPFQNIETSARESGCTYSLLSSPAFVGPSSRLVTQC